MAKKKDTQGEFNNKVVDMSKDMVKVVEQLKETTKILNERVELNAERIDHHSQGLDDLNNLLQRIATRMGLNE